MVSTPVPKNLYFDFYTYCFFFFFIMVTYLLEIENAFNRIDAERQAQSRFTDNETQTDRQPLGKPVSEPQNDEEAVPVNHGFKFLSYFIDNFSMYMMMLYIFLGAMAFGYMTYKTICLQYMSVHAFYLLFYLVPTVTLISWQSSRFLIIFFLVSCGYTAHKLDNNTDAYIRNIDTQQGNTVLLNEFFVALQKRSGDSHTTPLHVGLALHKLVYACSHKDEFVWDQCTEELSNGERVVKTFYQALEDVITSDKLVDPKFTSYIKDVQFNVDSFRKKSASTKYTQLELRWDLSVLGVSRLIVGQEYEKKIESLGRGLFNGNMLFDMIDDSMSAMQAIGFLPAVRKHVNIMTGFNSFKSLMHMIAKHGEVCLYGYCMQKGMYAFEINVQQVIRLNDTCIAQFCYAQGYVKQSTQKQTTVEILVNETVNQTAAEKPANKTVNQTAPEKPVERKEKTLNNPLKMKCNYTKEYCLANFPVQLKSNWMKFVPGAFTEPEVVLQPVSPLVNPQWPKSYPNQTIMNVHIKCNYTLDFCLEHFAVELKPTSFQQSLDMVKSATHGAVVVVGCVYALLGLGA